MFNRQPQLPPLAPGLNELGRLYGVHPVDITNGHDYDQPTHQLFDTLSFISEANPNHSCLMHQIPASEIESKTNRELPGTELGRIACQLNILNTNNHVRFGGHACQESEPYFLRAIQHIYHKTPLPADKGPAVLYVDVDGTPIALGKNHGDTTTILLRQSSKLPNAPAGTILMPGHPTLNGRHYLGNDEPFVCTNNPQLLVAEVRKPRAIKIVRPSVFSLSHELVSAVNYDPSDFVKDKLEIYARALAQTSLAGIVRTVDQIAADAKII
jgi:hypothetical protein